MEISKSSSRIRGKTVDYLAENGRFYQKCAKWENDHLKMCQTRMNREEENRSKRKTTIGNRSSALKNITNFSHFTLNCRVIKS